MGMPRLRALGLMTGSSCDALDIALIEVDTKAPHFFKARKHSTISFDPDLRAEVLRIQTPGMKFSLLELTSLDRRLGEWIASAVPKIDVDYISLHGQTIGHFPRPQGPGTTLQLGDPSFLAIKTGRTVISNFRNGDLAAQGQGAPLIPRFHQRLITQLRPQDCRHGVALHNIGGISNLTYLHPRGKIVAFDTGPGNVWIDRATQEASQGKLLLDRGGQLAAKVSSQDAAVAKLLSHPYFALKAPKSTGRDDFPYEFFHYYCVKAGCHGSARIRAATELTARTIVDAYQECVFSKGFPLRRIYFMGGGAKNSFLLELIRSWMPEGIEVLTTSEIGLDPQAVEAQAFAWLGMLSLQAQSLGGPWTGARDGAPPGRITPGRNWKGLLRKLR